MPRRSYSNSPSTVRDRSGHGKIGNKKEATRHYCEMISKGFVPKASTYSVLISDFAEAGKMNQTRELMNEMQARGISPDSSTYSIIICGWCRLSKQPEVEKKLRKPYRAEAKRLLMEMNEKGYVPGGSRKEGGCSEAIEGTVYQEVNMRNGVLRKKT